MRRELNEIEYFNWCLGQPYNMVVTVQVHGGLRADRLREALARAQQRHPLLGVGTEPGPGGRPWFSSVGVGPIPLEVHEGADPADAQQHATRELSSTFVMDLAGGSRPPLLRAALFLPRDPIAPADLVLTVQHVIADGLSMVFLVRDLLRFMEAPEAPVEVLDATASPADLLPARVRRWMPRTTILFRIVLWLVTLYAWIRPGRRNAPPSPGSHQPRAWTLTPEQTGRLRARCRQEGVSVQSAICTAFLPVFPAIHTPVSLRAALARPVGEAVGLFVGAAEAKMSYESTRGFWDNARRFHRRLRRAMRNPFAVFRMFSKAVPVALVRRLGTLMVRLTADRQPFAVTNLGQLDGSGVMPSGGALRIGSFSGAVTGIIDSSVLTVYTIGGRLQLHLLANEAAPMDTTLRDQADRAVQRLVEALEA